MRYKTLICCGVAVGVMQGLLATAAYAEQQAGVADTTDQGDGPAVGEIVVTAQKRSESINRVPMSITAATGAQLEAAGVAQPRDLIKIAPSFSYSTSQVDSPIYTIRGVGFADIGLGGRPTVSVYVDEAPIPFAVETKGTALDLERVEILKGPQGTLFGQNSTGGAINFIAAKPTNELQAGVEVSYGNFNAVTLGGFVSGPITETLSARLAWDHDSRDPWQRSYTTGERNGSVDIGKGRLILDWKPDARLSVSFTLSGFIDHSEVQATQLIGIDLNNPGVVAFIPGLADYPRSPRSNTAADFTSGRDYNRHNSFGQGTLRTDYSLTDGLTLTYLGTYSRFKEREFQDQDGTVLENIHALTVGKISSWSHELRFSGELNDRSHFVTGLAYSTDSVTESNFGSLGQSTNAYAFTPLGLPPYTGFTNYGRQKAKTYAVFGNVDQSIFDTVKIYGGLRYTNFRDNFSGCTKDPGDGTLASVFSAIFGITPAIPNGGCITLNNVMFQPAFVQSQLKENNLSWRAGAEWAPAPRTLIYANVSQGYKAGGYPQLAATVTSQLSPVKQEGVLAYEAGFKKSLFNRTLQVDGAFFYYKYNNKQILGKVQDPIFGLLLRQINIPRSEILGAEFQAAWAPDRHLTVSAGGSYLNTRIKGDFITFGGNGQSQNLRGNPFPNTPKWHLVADINYKWDISDRLDGFVGGSANYQSATNSQLGAASILRVDPYTLVDLRAGIETKDQAWRFSVWGRNVFDKYYWVGGNRPLDTVVRFAGMPATYGVTLGFKYR